MAFDLVHAVAGHVDSVINGPNGDYPSLVEALSGVDAAQAVDEQRERGAAQNEHAERGEGEEVEGGASDGAGAR